MYIFAWRPLTATNETELLNLKESMHKMLNGAFDKNIFHQISQWLIWELKSFCYTAKSSMSLSYNQLHYLIQFCQQMSYLAESVAEREPCMLTCLKFSKVATSRWELGDCWWHQYDWQLQLIRIKMTDCNVSNCDWWRDLTVAANWNLALRGRYWNNHHRLVTAAQPLHSWTRLHH